MKETVPPTEQRETPRPAESMLFLGQLYLLLAGAGLAVGYALEKVIRLKNNFSFLFAGAIMGFLLAFICGTRLTLPLYFGTTLGNELRRPGMPISINRAVALLLFLSVIMELKAMKLRLRFSWTLLFWGLFQVYYLTLAVIKQPEGAPLPIESLFYILVSLLIVLQYWQEKWMRWLLMSIVIMSNITLGLPGLIELVLRRDLTVNGFGVWRGRVSGLSSNAVFFAYVCTWAVPFAATLFIHAKSQLEKCLWLGSAGLLTMTAMAGLSRQTPILLGCMFVVYVLMIRYRHRSLLLGGALLLGLLLAPVFGPKIIERFSTTRDFRKDPSLSIRRDKLIVANEMIHDNFWLGVGNNYYPYRFREYLPTGELYLLSYIYQRYYNVDMGYVQIMTEYGAIGSFIVFLTLACALMRIGRYYIVSRALEDDWSANLMAAIAAVFVQLIVGMLIQDLLISPRTYFQIAMLLAITECIEQKRRQKLAEAAAA